MLGTGPANAQSAGSYTYTIIDVPGASGTAAGGINDAGQIVGEYADSSGKLHGFLDSGGVFTTIDVPGATATEASGINNSGQIVGQYVDSAGNGHGFLYSGNFTTIDPPGALSSGAIGINNAGQIVGGYASTKTGNHGYLYSGGVFTNIDAPDSLTNYPFNDGTISADRINNSGQIVGEWTCNGGADGCGFLDSGGIYSLVALPGADVSRAMGINDAGQIVGMAANCSGGDCTVNSRAFLDRGGTYTTIPVPGATAFFYGIAINNKGAIAGAYADSASVPHGFLATPPSFSITVVDAFGLPLSYNTDSVTPIPTLLLSSQGLSVGGCGTGCNGVAADGAATLLLQVPTAGPGQVTFQVTGTGDATLDGQLYDPVAGGTPVCASCPLAVQTSVVSGSGNEAFALYRAPIDYAHTIGDGTTQRSLNINVAFTPSGASQPQTLAQALTIVRPPIVLVHGFWGEPDDWNKFAAELAKQIPGINTNYRANYAATNTASFATNGAVVPNAINHALTATTHAGYASVQADVVGHSMGGILGRLWTENSNYYSALNYYAGSIHKLVTVDTPHLGAFVMPAIIAYVQTGNLEERTLAWALSWFGKSLQGGAFQDLAPGSQPLIAMNTLISFAPAFAIIGTDSNAESSTCGATSLGALVNIIATLNLAYDKIGLSSYNFSLPTSLNPNDVLVETASQSGLLSTNASYPYCHTAILLNPPAADETAALLNSPVSSLASGFQ